MTACLAAGAMVLHLTAGIFSLHWTHSVERVAWEEDWSVSDSTLRLDQFRIKGSGAGMEPGADAVWRDGWWVSPGHLQVPSLRLSASGATQGGWTLCADGACHTLGAQTGQPITVAPCGLAR